MSKNEKGTSVMETLTISLSAAQKAFVDEQVATGKFRSPSDYVAKLLERAEIREERERINALLEEGLAGERKEITPEFWEELRQEIRASTKEKRHEGKSDTRTRRGTRSSRAGKTHQPQ